MIVKKFCIVSLLVLSSMGAAWAEGEGGLRARPNLKAGQIALIDRGSGDTLRYAEVGDTITVDVVLKGRAGDPLTGLAFFLDFDPVFLSPIDADTLLLGLQPVRSEGLITGANVIANEFNRQDPNRYKGILYAEGLLSGASSADSGRVGSVAFRMLKAIPHGGDVVVSVERDTAIFRSSYQTRTAAGLTFPLIPWNALHLTVPPPVLSLPASLTTRQDTTLILDLEPLARDPTFPASALVWTIRASDPGFTVTVADSARTARLVPPAKFTGLTTLSLTATNPLGASATGSVTLRVVPPNRPPVISAQFPDTIRLTRGRSDRVNLNLLVSDPEVTILFLRWSFSGAKAVQPFVDPSRFLEITAPATWRGLETVTLTVTDPEGESASVAFVADGSAQPIPGDFNSDGRVDLEDFFSFAVVFGKGPGQAGFDPIFDLNGSKQVDMADFFMFAENFGRTE